MNIEELHAALEAAWPGASQMQALSIQQPWAHNICHNGKDIENRSWKTSKLGWFLVHAGKKFDVNAGSKAPARNFLMGGIVGVMEIVDCVSESDSHWFQGEYGFVIENARPLPFIPCKGALSFFKPKPYEDK